MNQERLAQRDKMAQEYQLGVLEMQCTPMIKGWVTLAGVVVGFCLLFWLLIDLYGGNVIGGLKAAGLALLGTLGLLALGFIFVNFSIESVYIYTHGLIYMNRHRSGLVRWEGIKRVDLQPGFDESPTTLAIHLNDGTRIDFPVWCSRGSASLYTLSKFIQERVPPAHQHASAR